MTSPRSSFTPQQIETSTRILARTRWRREIDRRHRDGESTEAIAAELGDDVETIQSEIDILMIRPNQLVRRPSEVIDAYIVGERSREDLISVLSNWPYTYGQLGVTPGMHPLSSDAWDRGTWNDVTRAELNGLIDVAAFVQIAIAADLPAAVFPQWVNEAGVDLPSK